MAESLIEQIEVVSLLETSTQGPPGPTGPAGADGEGTTTYAGKTLVYAGDELAEILLYGDAAKTVLLKRKVMTYTSGILTLIETFDGAGTLLVQQTLGYSGDRLVTITQA